MLKTHSKVVRWLRSPVTLDKATNKWRVRVGLVTLGLYGENTSEETSESAVEAFHNLSPASYEKTCHKWRAQVRIGPGRSQ